MSTKSTVICGEIGDLRMHLYKEMHDGLYHLELDHIGGSYSAINVIIPKDMFIDLKRMFRGEGTEE